MAVQYAIPWHMLKGLNPEVLGICTLKGSVPTGFEPSARDEISSKLKSVAYCARGRVFFDVKLDQVPQALKLRSVDHVTALIAVNPKFGFSNDKVLCLKRLRLLPRDLDWNKALTVWQRVSSFAGDPFTRRPDHRLERVDLTPEVGPHGGGGGGDGVRSLLYSLRAPVTATRPTEADGAAEAAAGTGDASGAHPVGSECGVSGREGDGAAREKDGEVKERGNSGVEDDAGAARGGPGGIVGDVATSGALPVGIVDQSGAGEPVPSVDPPCQEAAPARSHPPSDPPEPTLVSALPLCSPDSLLAPAKPDGEVTEPAREPATQEAEPAPEPAAQEGKIIPEPAVQRPELAVQESKHAPELAIQEHKSASEPAVLEVKPAPQPTVGEAGLAPESAVQDVKPAPEPAMQEVKPASEPAPVLDPATAKAASVGESADSAVPSFRATCSRVGGGKPGHAFSSNEAAEHFGGAVQDLFDWRVKMKKQDIEVTIDIEFDMVTVGLSLTPRALFYRNLAKMGPTSLRSTVCFNLLQMARPQPHEVVLDPMCGGGSLSLEGVQAFPGTFHLCGDNYRDAAPRAALNRAHSSRQCSETRELAMDILTWDCTRLPLRDACADVIVCDMPFGKRMGSRTDNRTLYPACLEEMARVCVTRYGRAVILTQDKNSMQKTLQQPRMKQLWRTRSAPYVNIGGLNANAYLLQRTDSVRRRVAARPPGGRAAPLPSAAAADVSTTTADVTAKAADVPASAADVISEAADVPASTTGVESAAADVPASTTDVAVVSADVTVITTDDAAAAADVTAASADVTTGVDYVTTTVTDDTAAAADAIATAADAAAAAVTSTVVDVTATAADA